METEYRYSVATRSISTCQCSYHTTTLRHRISALRYMPSVVRIGSSRAQGKVTEDVSLVISEGQLQRCQTSWEKAHPELNITL